MSDREEYQKGVYAAYNASGSAAAQIGLAAMKAGVLLNGGALLALLAFAAQVVGKNGTVPAEVKTVFAEALFFVLGLVGSLVSFCSAYLHQITTTDEFAGFAELSTDVTKPMPLPFRVRETPFRERCKRIYVGATIVTLLLFICGATTALVSLALPTSPAVPAKDAVGSALPAPAVSVDPDKNSAR